MGSDNPKLSENQDSCSQTKPVRNKKGLLPIQLLSLRQKCRWSQFISGLIAVSTSKSHLDQWPFCYQHRQRCQELQDQRAFVLLQALAWPPSLQCLCRAIIPYDRWGTEAKRCLSSTRQPVQERGLNSPPNPAFLSAIPSWWGIRALQPLCPLLKKTGLVLLTEQQGTRKRLLFAAFLMGFYLAGGGGGGSCFRVAGLLQTLWTSD